MITPYMKTVMVKKRIPTVPLPQLQQHWQLQLKQLQPTEQWANYMMKPWIQLTDRGHIKGSTLCLLS